MELELPATVKDMHGMYSLYVGINHEEQNTHDTEKFSKKEGSSKDS